MAPRKAQFSRKEIVETAFEMVRKNGWDGMTVPAVARTIKSSTMPIYSHFKNVRELQDAVYLKVVDMMLEFMSGEQTGDKWIDHAIGYLEFAQQEEQLFRCLYDGRNLELSRSALDRWNDLLLEQLADYPLFDGMNDELVQKIRYARYMLLHGMATNVNRWCALKDEKVRLKFLKVSTKALYDGIKSQYEAVKFKD